VGGFVADVQGAVELIVASARGRVVARLVDARGLALRLGLRFALAVAVALRVLVPLGVVVAPAV
jgi:hypothetical protein